MATLAIASRLDRARLAEIADGLAIAVAVSMPWSTSATGILLVLFLLALIPTLDWGGPRRELVKVAASRSNNPHNQTFAVAIQLGLAALVLWAMWIAHLLLFRGSGLVEWVGLVIVVQNIVGFLFNSYLFDFVQGRLYVLGVGAAGGMVLKKRAAERQAGASP